MTLSFLSRRLPLLTGLSAIALMPALPAAAQSPAAQSATASAAPAPLSGLVAKVDIPYEEFTLKNGLRVIVHTDRKAPIVAVSVWYHVGSRFEPAGKTGFAHLFEHLMFYGSENADGPFFGRLEDIGATDWNGTTWFDRTNYFECADRRAGPGAVPGKRSHGPSAGCGHPGEARYAARGRAE